MCIRDSNMTSTCIQICRKCSIMTASLLLLQFVFAQTNLDKAGEWLQSNLDEFGGRAVLVILKNGKIVYEKTENNLSRKQRIARKFIARRQGKNPDEFLQDYTFTTRDRIASSSKWLSAALVM